MAAIKRIVAAGAFAALTLSLATGNASAEDYSKVEGYIHSFNNNVSVYSGVFALNKDVDLDTSVYFKYNIDIINPDAGGGDGGGGGDDEGEGGEDDALIKSRAVSAVSGASSAVSSAGGSSATDTRHALTLGASRNFNNIIGAEAYLDYSTESDYRSLTPTVTLKKDFFEKNTTLTLGYSRNMDTVSGRFMESAEDKTVDNFFAGVTQVLSQFTIAQIGYSRNESSGFQSEGIRLVPVDGVAADTCTDETATCVEEVFPETRSRNAYLAGVNHYFSGGLLDRSSIKLTARYYNDDWDITSYTGDVEYYKYLSEEWLLRLNYRYYTQTAAFFVKDSYSSVDEFKSSSPQLEALDSNLYGAKLAYLFKEGEKISDTVSLGTIEGKYEYYTETIGVNAHIIMAAIRLIF